MSLILCPECGNECSASATSCPNCGHPFVAPKVVPPPVIVKEVPVERDFPNWIFIPLAVFLGILIFGIVYMIRENPDNANEQVNVRIRETNGNRQTTRTTTTADSQTVTVPKSANTTVVIPPSSQTREVQVTEPSSPPTYSSSSAETVKVEPTPSNKASVEINATVAGKGGSTQPVKKEKFYLLSKDLETIFSKAGISPEDGDYTTSLSTALNDPDKRDTLKKYLAAINPYIIASTLTDSDGKAKFKDVKPDSYYLFGMHKTNDAVSVWNTNVTLNAGENTVALNAQTYASKNPTNY